MSDLILLKGVEVSGKTHFFSSEVSLMNGRRGAKRPKSERDFERNDLSFEHDMNSLTSEA